MSTSTEYGGTRAVLYWKKRADETCGLWWWVSFDSQRLAILIRTSLGRRHRPWLFAWLALRLFAGSSFWKMTISDDVWKSMISNVTYNRASR